MGLTHKVNSISFEFTLPEKTKKTTMCLDYLSKLNVTMLWKSINIFIWN